MRAGTQIAHSVTRVTRGSKCRQESPELTQQGRQLRNLTTPNASFFGKYNNMKINNGEAFSSQITQKKNFLSPQRESNP